MTKTKITKTPVVTKRCNGCRTIMCEDCKYRSIFAFTDEIPTLMPIHVPLVVFTGLRIVSEAGILKKIWHQIRPSAISEYSTYKLTPSGNWRDHEMTIHPYTPDFIDGEIIQGRVWCPSSHEKARKRSDRCETREIDKRSLNQYIHNRLKQSLQGSLMDQIVYQLENGYFPKSVYQKCEWFLKHIHFSNSYYDYNTT